MSFTVSPLSGRPLWHHKGLASKLQNVCFSIHSLKRGRSKVLHKTLTKKKTQMCTIHPPSWWEPSWDPGRRRPCCPSAGHRCPSWPGPGGQTGGCGGTRPARRAGWGRTPCSRAPRRAAGGWWGAWCAPGHTGQCRRGPVSLQGCDLEKHMVKLCSTILVISSFNR